VEGGKGTEEITYMKTYLILYCDTACLGLPFAVWQVEAESFTDALRQWNKYHKETWKMYQVTMI